MESDLVFLKNTTFFDINKTTMILSRRGHSELPPEASHGKKLSTDSLKTQFTKTCKITTQS